jgi:uncharacterized membrane protein YoaT (DUF817 family)
MPLHDLRSVSESAARIWPPTAHFIAREQTLGAFIYKRGALARAGYEFLRFGVKQGWACLFGGLMVALLVLTHLFYPKGAALARYDFLVVAAAAIQLLMLALRFETKEEAKVIILFHIVGTGMEIFKTATGSWIYPEPSLLRIGGVPLFTGFMYGAVGSYIARAWRLFDFRFAHHPPFWTIGLLSTAIYINFFADHYAIDLRYGLLAVTGLLFRRTIIFFKVWRIYRRMPLLLGFTLVALFIWFAENAGTAARAWLYPNQITAWSQVPIGKLGSWFLLMIISYTMVAWINRPRNSAQSIAGHAKSLICESPVRSGPTHQ